MKADLFADQIPFLKPWLGEEEAAAVREVILSGWVSLGPKVAEFGRAIADYGVGLAVSVPLAVGISMLEMIVVLVQAYVFTLLSAVFIGMAIHAHH